MSSLGTIRGVVYDLDGTIIDATKVHADGWRAAGADYRVSITESFLQYQMGKTNEDAAEHLLGEQRYHEFGKDFIEAKKRYAETHAGEASYFEDFNDAYHCLQQRGIPVWICTSSPRRFCEAVFGRIHALASFESCAVWREMYRRGKPDPEALQRAFTKMGVNAQQVIYIGDALSDCQAALNAQCQFVYYLRDPAAADPQFPPDVPRIARHGELLKLLPSHKE